MATRKTSGSGDSNAFDGRGLKLSATTLWVFPWIASSPGTSRTTLVGKAFSLSEVAMQKKARVMLMSFFLLALAGFVKSCKISSCDVLVLLIPENILWM